MVHIVIYFAWSTVLLTSININVWSPMIGELIITWDLEYNDTCTLNSSDPLNMTQLDYYTINTSNCGMCPTTTSSTSVTCNLTMSDLLAGMYTCNITVIVHAMVCGITSNATSEQYSVHLMNGEVYHELTRGIIIIICT